MKRRHIVSPVLLAAPALAFLALSGCGTSSAEFRPAATADDGRVGPRAAYYDIETAGRRVGSVKVWSPGAYRAAIDGETARVLDVALRVRNDSETPLEVSLAESDVEITTRRGGARVLAQPIRRSGGVTVAPGRSERIHLYYELPERVAPVDVESFELNWSVRGQDGRYSQSTAFVQRSDERGYVTYAIVEPWYPYRTTWYPPHDDPRWF